jgi:hypothetical protein
MKFHYANLASCVTFTLLLPFVAVADIVTPLRDDQRLPDWAPHCSDCSDADDTCSCSCSGPAIENDQIQDILPTERKHWADEDLSDGHFCDGKPIRSILLCDSILGDDISLHLVDGITYTIQVQRLTCALDPFTLLISPYGAVLSEADDVNAPPAFLFCDNDPSGDPEIALSILRSGDFTLRTFAAVGVCPPEGGYEYQVKIDCELYEDPLYPNGEAHVPGKTWRGQHYFDYISNVIYGWYRHGLLIFLRWFRLI